MSRSTPASDPAQPFYAPPGTPDGQDPGAPESTLFGWLGRHLRGRMILAAVLLPLFAGLGGVVGYHLIVPTFRSTAVLQFAPEASPILYGSREDRAIPMFDAFLEAQLVAIRHPDVVRDALQTDAWSDFSVRTDLDAAGFRDALTAERTKRTQTIDVVFEHEDAEAARAGVRSAVAAYVASFRDAYAGEADTQIEVLTAYLQDVLSRQAALEERELALTNAYEAAGLTQMHEARLAEINDLHAQLRGVEQQRAVTERQVQALAQRVEDAPPTGNRDDQLAARDADYAAMLAELQDRRREADRVRARTGDRHLQVVRLDREVASLRDRLDARAADLEEQHGSAAAETTAGMADLTARLDDLGSLRETLRTQIGRAETESAELGRRRVEIRQIEADLLATNQLIKDTQFKLEAQKLEAHRTSPLTVLTNGDTPNRIHMGRKQTQAAVMGAALGGGGGLGLLLLWGTLDRRLHGFRDVRDRFPRQPVLALVPTLQGDLSDPDESLTAAMAVHEIRARLQRTFRDVDDEDAEPGKVLTLTGPTPGVGKTTLSMALAMSFARTGTRTLLIDLDLIGRGVTERCGLQDVPEGDGVLAALAGESIDKCFHPSLVRHLWVMPASREGERRVADLARKHVRRLIREARKNFEMVIVDTGPLLGSLECSLVLPESDDVLLVVSRGDGGAVVRQAIERLTTDRVRLAGLIFNRAAPKDCERFSSSLTSRTSAPSHPVHLRPPVGVLAATRQYGPVAYATASCLSRDN